MDQHCQSSESTGQKLLREQERILGEMQSHIHRWMDDLLRDAFNPESVFRMVESMGLNFSQIYGMTKPQENPDPYRVLDLDRTATDQEVRERYRKLVKKLHPDTSGDSNTVYMFWMLDSAYQQIAKERGWGK